MSKEWLTGDFDKDFDEFERRAASKMFTKAEKNAFTAIFLRRYYRVGLTWLLWSFGVTLLYSTPALLIGGALGFYSVCNSQQFDKVSWIAVVIIEGLLLYPLLFGLYAFLSGTGMLLLATFFLSYTKLFGASHVEISDFAAEMASTQAKILGLALFFLGAFFLFITPVVIFSK